MSNADRCRRYRINRHDRDMVRDMVRNMLPEIIQELKEYFSTWVRHAMSRHAEGFPPIPPNGSPLDSLPFPPLIPPSQQKPPQRRGTRLPADFQVSEEWKEEGRAIRDRVGLPTINLDLEAEHFVDFWHSKPGKDGSKLDWRATWRNWCRNARTTTKPLSNGAAAELPNGKAAWYPYSSFDEYRAAHPLPGGIIPNQ